MHFSTFGLLNKIVRYYWNFWPPEKLDFRSPDRSFDLLIVLSISWKIWLLISWNSTSWSFPFATNLANYFYFFFRNSERLSCFTQLLTILSFSIFFSYDYFSTLLPSLTILSIFFSELVPRFLLETALLRCYKFSCNLVCTSISRNTRFSYIQVQFI